MTLKSKPVATAKKVARPPVKHPHPDPDPDPMGFRRVLAEISTKLTEIYQERLDVLLSKYLLVEFEPAELQSIVGTTQEWPPVTLPATLTVYPRDASGVTRVDGALETPAAAPQPDRAPETAEDREYINSIFNSIFGEKIPASQLKSRRRSKGRRR